MTRHRYPTLALIGDYMRAGTGLAVAAAPLCLVQLAPPVAALFAGLALLFAIFAGRTLLLQLGAIEMNPVEIRSIGPLARRIPWTALDELRLAYFTTAPRSRRFAPLARSAERGWMQLALGGGGRRLRLDSRIEGFLDIAAQAAATARQRRLRLGPATSANLAALGLAPGEEP